MAIEKFSQGLSYYVSSFNTPTMKHIYFIIFSVLFLFLLLILLVRIVKRYFKNRRILKIGKAGEQKVRNLLNLNPRKYYVINDVMLRHPNKKTSQIDHIVISRKGIVVIETKNYSGVVLGNVKDNYWNHIAGKNKHIVYNIVYQNQGHINAIKNCVDDILLRKLSKRKYKKFFVSILLFNNSCHVKVKKPFFYRIKFRIANFDNLIYKIKKGHRRNLISKSDYKQLILAIQKNNISSSKTIKNHIREIKKIKRM